LARMIPMNAPKLFWWPCAFIRVPEWQPLEEFAKMECRHRGIYDDCYIGHRWLFPSRQNPKSKRQLRFVNSKVRGPVHFREDFSLFELCAIELCTPYESLHPASRARPSGMHCNRTVAMSVHCPRRNSKSRRSGSTASRESYERATASLTMDQ
jgi:hypothetical protein